MSVEFTVFKGSATGIVESKTHQAAPRGNPGPRQNYTLRDMWHRRILQADMVLGHEGVGTVQQIESVRGFTVGDIVGWGYTHKTCGTCEQCLLGRDQYCPDRELYGSRAGVRRSAQCGGATIFEVIESYNIRSTHRVGVVGIGGLGHLAIQFLAKRGNTESKREEALRLGATEFYATQGVEKFEMGKPDHLLVTTSLMPDWNPYLSAMKPRSTIYPLTVSFSPLVIPPCPSAVAARSAHKKMLEFAARHHIEPVIERFPMTLGGVKEGMARLREGKMRYRAVLVA
ncbi:putative NADP-dependent alcohol dehydrogenase C 2 [Mycena latifolia]|nr:putative NADP-dependent alcohol dehydrogenase C 2 [Mycena latifolia]